ncbi:MAG: hypothetical protein AAGA48_40080 [Myxococcota bacterium]
MWNVAAAWFVVALLGCSKTPCELESDLVVACSSEAASDDNETDPPECADESVDACLAQCTVDREAEACSLIGRTATEAKLKDWLDCRESCLTEPDVD